MSQDRVRVLRLIEYEGDRDVVEEQIAKSIQGTHIIPRANRNPLRITAVTLGVYPDVIEPARAVAFPKAVEDSQRAIDFLMTENARLRASFDDVGRVCPKCGSEDFRVVNSTTVEPHGETVEQEYFVCNTCDTRFDK